MPRVVILQKSLPQYREPFFTGLREKLAEDNITLELIYGNSDEGRKDGVKMDWATYRKNRHYNLGLMKLIWQPCLKEVRTADLVIVEQANKLLINYVLLWRKLFGRQRFAFWGHGLDRQAHKLSPQNLFKRLMLKRASWWFAYTGGVRDFLVRNGYAAERITVVQNAIDTRRMITEYNQVSAEELEDFRLQHGIKPGEQLLIYCGALYKEKRIDFLVETADRLHQAGVSFRLVIVGSGPDEQLVKEAADSRPYILFTGPLFGKEKAKMFHLSSLFLLPGAIGLAVLDSFAYATPIVATDYRFHGPEFDYLVNDYNGVITENNIGAYVAGVLSLLNDPARLESLKKNCREEAGRYTNESMVQNFAAGIKAFLARQKN